MPRPDPAAPLLPRPDAREEPRRHVRIVPAPPYDWSLEDRDPPGESALR